MHTVNWRHRYDRWYWERDMVNTRQASDTNTSRTILEVRKDSLQRSDDLRSDEYPERFGKQYWMIHLLSREFIEKTYISRNWTLISRTLGRKTYWRTEVKWTSFISRVSTHDNSLTEFRNSEKNERTCRIIVIISYDKWNNEQNWKSMIQKYDSSENVRSDTTTLSTDAANVSYED